MCRPYGRWILSTLAAAAVGATFGCSGDTTGAAPEISPSQTYFALILNQHAVNMSLVAPSNTIQLTATPVNAYGAPLPDSGRVTFRSTDSSVTVTSSGLVKSYFVTPLGGTVVIATVQLNNITFADTAYIRVTETPLSPELATFSIHPPPGDSAIARLGLQYAVNVTATDVAGQTVPFNPQTGSDNIYWLKVSNPSIGHIEFAPFLTVLDTGDVTLYATTWMYGKAFQDSLTLRVGWSLNKIVFVDTSKSTTVFLAVNGVVNWVLSIPDSVDIVFDDSTAVDSALTLFGQYTGRGNVYIPPALPLIIVDTTTNTEVINGVPTEVLQIDTTYQPTFKIEARSFPKVGTYHYHSRMYPRFSGTISVNKDR